MSGTNVFERIVERIDDSISFITDNSRYFAIIFLILIIGFAAGALATTQKNTPQTQIASGDQNVNQILTIPYNTYSSEKPSPSERIKETQIHVYNDKILIDIKDAEWATFTDSNSMDPVIDIGSYAIEIIPKSEGEIVVGDIISYKSEYASGTIIHRVVEISSDEDGWYCKTKGDNNKEVDPGKIRFSQIKRVVVGIIY